jgi:hypothetical protein
MKGECSYDSDENGKGLGHAFFPTKHQISFYAVLLYEIGHILNLDHSSRKSQLCFLIILNPLIIIII